MEEKDLEQLVLQGLEIETIEKEKASERKALKRKNGLKFENARYQQNVQGQTRDIVAKKLGCSGKHWERMKSIYYHRNYLDSKEYEEWRKGKLSTSKIYNRISQDTHYKKTLDKMIITLENMQTRIHQQDNAYIHVDIEHNLERILYNCHKKTKEDVYSELKKLKQHDREFTKWCYKEISIMKDDISELKKHSKINKK